jgi:hypothetical protein
MPPKRKQQASQSTPIKQDFCTKNILFPGQYGETCWFNALLLCLLYSQRCRKLMLKASANWTTEIRLFRLFNYILRHKYVKTNKPNKDKIFFQKVTPEVILKMLNKYDNSKFMLTDYTFGFYPIIYLRSICELFNISCIGITLYEDHIVSYDRYNKIDKVNADKIINTEYKRLTPEFVQSELAVTPDILSVRCKTIPFTSEAPYMKTIENRFYLLNSTIGDDRIFQNMKNIQSKADTIIYNNEIYDLDSVILPNIDEDNHVIAGITCHNKKYVYNGWIYENHDSPCELMRFDWDVNKENYFCLNPYNCGLLKFKSTIDCYSFDKQERLLIYVKRNRTSPVLQHSPSPIELPKYVPYKKKNKESTNSADKKRAKVLFNDDESSLSSYNSFFSMDTPLSYQSISPIRGTPDTPLGTLDTPSTPGRSNESNRSNRSNRSNSSLGKPKILMF